MPPARPSRSPRCPLRPDRQRRQSARAVCARPAALRCGRQCRGCTSEVRESCPRFHEIGLVLLDEALDNDDALLRRLALGLLLEQNPAPLEEFLALGLRQAATNPAEAGELAIDDAKLVPDRDQRCGLLHVALRVRGRRCIRAGKTILLLLRNN